MPAPWLSAPRPASTTRTRRWRKALPKATGGIDLVFDGAPASSYPNYGRALNMGARVVIYGSTGGVQFPVNAPELFLKNIAHHRHQRR